jgi:hypothetical protein
MIQQRKRKDMNDDNQTPLSANANGKSEAPRVETNMRAAAYSKTHERKIVSVIGNKLMTVASDGREHAYTVTPDAKVTCDDVVCRSDELRPGITIRVTTLPNNRTAAVKIESFDKPAKG